MTTMIEKVARAMEEAEMGYSMNLIRLVDGVSTYRLTYSDSEVLEFENTDDLYLHVSEKKRRTQALAAIEAMRDVNPTKEMMEAMWSMKFANTVESFSVCWSSMIDAALKEQP